MSVLATSRREPADAAPAADDGAAIEISALRHRYGTREALRGVSLSIARGELFALLGPNGGGKTTLFRILSTLMEPREGVVRVLGRDLPACAPIVRRRMG
ncbi:MAG: ATP-binding cassette domain-containing protein, partial [Candidatus Binatia bacterium]